MIAKNSSESFSTINYNQAGVASPINFAFGAPMAKFPLIMRSHNSLLIISVWTDAGMRPMQQKGGATHPLSWEHARKMKNVSRSCLYCTQTHQQKTLYYIHFLLAGCMYCVCRSRVHMHSHVNSMPPQFDVTPTASGVRCAAGKHVSTKQQQPFMQFAQIRNYQDEQEATIWWSWRKGVMKAWMNLLRN
jgi:hypothetical protein